MNPYSSLHPNSVYSSEIIEEDEVIDDLDKMSMFDGDDLEEEEGEEGDEVDASFLSLIRRISCAPTTGDEDWRRTSIFQTLVLCGKATKKLIIDGGSSMNVVSESTVQKLNLPTEPHPEPYKVAWIDNTTIPVTERCLVNIKRGAYNDSIWCDVIPMIATHILLGRPWLYDREVKHDGRSNIYEFDFNDKHIVLKPQSPELMKKHQAPSLPKLDIEAMLKHCSSTSAKPKGDPLVPEISATISNLNVARNEGKVFVQLDKRVTDESVKDHVISDEKIPDSFEKYGHSGVAYTGCESVVHKVQDYSEVKDEIGEVLDVQSVVDTTRVKSEGQPIITVVQNFKEPFKEGAMIKLEGESVFQNSKQSDSHDSTNTQEKKTEAQLQNFNEVQVSVEEASELSPDVIWIADRENTDFQSHCFAKESLVEPINNTMDYEVQNHPEVKVESVEVSVENSTEQAMMESIHNLTGSESQQKFPMDHKDKQLYSSVAAGNTRSFNEDKVEVRLQNLHGIQVKIKETFLVTKFQDKVGKIADGYEGVPMMIEDNSVLGDFLVNIFMKSATNIVSGVSQIKVYDPGIPKIDFVLGEDYDETQATRFHMSFLIPTVGRKKFFHEDYALISWFIIQITGLFILKHFKTRGRVFSN